MTSIGPGIGINNIARFSRLRLIRETFIAFAADANYIVAAEDISATVVGDAFTLTAAADGVLLPVADFVTLTVTDAAGTNLSLTVKVEGYHRGVKQSESITSTGAPATGTTTKVYDEVTSITVTAIANKAASDTADVGFAGTRIGLWHRIEKVADVKRIIHDDAGTPTVIAISASTVDLTNSALKITGAANDRYVVEYLASTKESEGWAPNGAMAG